MCKNILLSVAMCTYNGSAYVHEQLKSISNQTLVPDELVICDDGSTDNTVAIIREYAKEAEIEVILIENSTNLGSSKNFEQAISCCRGEIIALADQDDIWLPEKLETLVAALAGDPEVAFVFSDAYVVGNQLEPMHYNLWESGNVQFNKRLRKRFTSIGPVDVLLRRYIVTGATMAFRASLKNIVLPLETSWVHDGWIAFIAAASGFKAAFVEKPLILYRQHADQQIGASKPAKERGMVLTVYDFFYARYDAWKRGKKMSLPSIEYSYWEDAKRVLLERETIRRDNTQLDKTIKLIDGKIRHQKVRRAVLSKPRLARVWPVISELLNGNYSRYSYNVLIQTVKDVLY